LDGSAVKPDHDQLPAFTKDADTKRHRLRRADKIDRRSRPASGCLHHLFDGVRGCVIDRSNGTHLASMRTLLRVDIGDDDPTPVDAQMIAGFLER
jgi:hypothetical protein